MSKSRDLANIISGGFTADDIPNLDASKITTGNFADARLSESSITQHVTEFDDNKIVNDISTLALRQASDNDKSAYSTNSSFVDVFQDATGIDTTTNVFRNTSEYVGSGETLNSATITRWQYYSVGSSAAIATWNIQGSNDDSNWTTLYTGLNVANHLQSYANTGTFSNTTSYRYYRSYKTNGASGGGYHSQLQVFDSGGQLDISGATFYENGLSQSSNFGERLTDGNISTTAFHTDSSGVGSWLKFDLNNYNTNINATGNFTGTTITADSSVSSMGAIITYQDNAGTNALNTDIVLQLSADGGSNYTTATLTAMPDFSTGIKMAKVNDLAVTAGTQLKYKISFANQASGSKEARIRGVSLQY